MSTAGVTANSSTTAPLDITAGEVVTPTRAMKCQVTVIGYAPLTAITSNTQLAVISRSNNTNTVFGGVGGPLGSMPLPQPLTAGTTAVATFVQVGNLSSGVSHNFGCRFTNLASNGVPFSCNISWVCF